MKLKNQGKYLEKKQNPSFQFKKKIKLSKKNFFSNSFSLRVKIEFKVSKLELQYKYIFISAYI